MKFGFGVLAFILTGVAPVVAQGSGQYQMHFAAISCRIGHCPDWVVTDLATKETFYAVVVLPAGLPNGSEDVVVDATRTSGSRWPGDTYAILTVSRVVQGAAAPSK